MWYSAFAVRIAVEELSALERLPVYPLVFHLVLLVLLALPALPARQVRPGIPGIPRQVPVLEKIPYVIAPFQ
jgi:hypothetical protein